MTEGPDIFDLQDWLVLNRNEVWKAVKHLHMHEVYEVALDEWKRAGCPEIRDERSD